MISLRVGELLDLWGIAEESAEPELRSLSYALKVGMDMMFGAADRIGLYYDIPGLDEDVLDYMALELRSMYYDQTFSKSKKQDIVSKTLAWHMMAGTTGAVQEMIDVIFGGGDVIEWFDTEDLSAGEFNIDARVLRPGMASDMAARMQAVLSRVKNERSHLGTLTATTDASEYPISDDETIDASCRMTEPVNSGIGVGYTQNPIPLLTANRMFILGNVLYVDHSGWTMSDGVLTINPNDGSLSGDSLVLQN